MADSDFLYAFRDYASNFPNTSPYTYTHDEEETNAPSTPTTTPSDAAGELPEYNYDQLEWARNLYSTLLQNTPGISTGYADSLNTMISNMNAQLPAYLQFLNNINPSYNTLMGQAQADFSDISNLFANWMGQAQGLYGSTIDQANALLPTIYQLIGQGINTTAGGTGALSQAQDILSSITNNTQGGLNAWTSSFWDALSGAGNMGDIISNLISSGQQNLQTYAPTLWNQYGGMYNQLANAFQNVLSGQLPAQTQQNLQNLFQSQYDTALLQTQDWQNEQRKVLIDNLASRGILTSGEAAQALGYIDKQAQEKLAETRNNLLTQQYQMALALPFQQMSSALEQMQALDRGVNVAGLTNQAYEALLPYLQTGLESATMPASIGSSYLNALSNLMQTETGAGSSLANVGLGYGDLGSQIIASALGYLQPSQLLSTLATNYGNLGTQYAGTEYGASGQLANLLGSLLGNATGQNMTGYQNLFETLMNQPTVLNQAFESYGGLSSDFTELLVSEYLKRLETEAYLAAAKMQADAARANADASGDASMWGAIGSIIGGLF